MEKFRKYIDKKFTSYPKSRALDELKEELIATLLERYQEYLSNGLNEEDSYRKAIESIGDCKETVNLIESNIDKKTKVLRTRMAIWGSILYWLTVSTIFLTVSMITQKWIYTWIIYPVAAAIYLCIALAIVFPKGRSLGKNSRIRISVILSFLIITLGVYFLVSFFSKMWAITWVIFLIGFSLGMICDAIMIRKSHKTLFSVYFYLIICFLTSAIYQLITHFEIVKASLSWLIYLFAIICILIYNFIKIVIKYKAETSFKNNKQ